MEANSTATKVRRWRTRDVGERAEVKSGKARQLIAQMVEAGVLASHGGKTWWGRPGDVDAWLLGRWAEASTAQGRAR